MAIRTMSSNLSPVILVAIDNTHWRVGRKAGVEFKSAMCIDLELTKKYDQFEFIRKFFNLKISDAGTQRRGVIMQVAAGVVIHK